MAEGWERYGVDENIFEAPVLDCVRNSEDRDRFGGFFFSDEEDKALEKQLKAAIREKALAFYLITGPDGSGRTAFARKLVQRYAQLKGADLAKFAFAEYDPENNVSATQVLHELVTSLANEAQLLEPAIGQDPSAELRRKLDASPASNFNAIDIQGGLRAFSQTMKTAGGGFACVLENSTRAEMITLGRKLFEKADTILVATVRESDRGDVLTPLESSGKAKFTKIEMPRLTQRQTWEALEHRWRKWQAADKIPLPQPAVESHIALPPPTMGWLLTQAALMFDYKLITNQRGEVWPNDPQLGFDENEVKSALAFVRKAATRGR